MGTATPANLRHRQPPVLPRVATSLGPNQNAQPGHTVWRRSDDRPWRGSPPPAHLAWLAPSLPRPADRALGQGLCRTELRRWPQGVEPTVGSPHPRSPCEHKARRQLAQDTGSELVTTEGRQGLKGQVGTEAAWGLWTNDLFCVPVPTKATSWSRETLSSVVPPSQESWGPWQDLRPRQHTAAQELSPMRTEPQEGACPGPAWPHRAPA